MASLSRALRPAAVARRQLPSLFARRAFASKGGPIHIDSEPDRELQVGELQGAKFRIEPLRRTGEDEHTMRARLLYQSRKRGILESDLLMSTFADSHLPTMSKTQMEQYDLFLDENDWDIYYWATQDESPGPDTTPTTRRTSEAPAEDVPVRDRKEGEWAQTVGTFKPAYRPVPARWKDSEVLEMLRAHVRSRRADPKAGSDAAPAGEEKGMGFMPPLFEMRRNV